MFEEGNLEEASQRYDELAAETRPLTSVNWRAGVLALGVRIAIRQEASVGIVRPIVTDLEGAHLQNRNSGGEDFEAHALALGLRYCGESERAFRLLSEYAATHRRERWALPDNLSDLLKELRGDYEVSTDHKPESLFIANIHSA